LKADVEHQPVKQRRGVAPVNGGSQLFVGKPLDQVERTGQTTDLVNQASGVINSGRFESFWVWLRSRLNLNCGAVGGHAHSNQRYELALGIGVAVDVPLGGLDRPVASEQLDIAQRTPGLVHQPSRPSNESAAARVRRAAVETDVAERRD
jgi:hypothetical protein